MSSQPSFKPRVLSSIMNIIEKETRYLQNCQNNSKNVSEAICQKHKIERRLSGPLIYKYILLFKTSINISIFLNRPCNFKKLAYFRRKCCFTLQFHFTYTQCVQCAVVDLIFSACRGFKSLITVDYKHETFV